MSYITRRGRNYEGGVFDEERAALGYTHGFGAIDPGGALSRAEYFKSNPQALATYIKTTVSEKYGATLTNSAAIVKQLSDVNKLGPVLAEALQNTLSPQSIADRAKQLGDLFSKDNLQKNAYKLFYSGTKASLEMVDQYLSASPIGALVGEGLKFAATTGDQAFSLSQGKSLTGKVDGSGALDCFALAKNVVLGLGRLATSIAHVAGANEAAKTAGIVMDFVGTAASCAMGAATAGPASGPYAPIGAAVGCVVGVLTTVLKTVFSGAGVTPTPGPEIPMATFSPQAAENGPSQASVISSDASRLAALLRYHYGVRRYHDIVPDGEPGRPGGLVLTDGGYPPKGAAQNGVPGYSGYDLLRLAQKLAAYQPLPTTDSSWVRNSMLWGMPIPCSVARLGDNPHAGKMLCEGDIPQDVIGAGADFASKLTMDALEQTGWTYTGLEKDLPIIGAGLALRGMPGPQANWGCVDYPATKVAGLNQGGNTRVFRPWLILQELVNFFAAVTISELDDLDGRIQVRSWFDGPLPIRFWAVEAPYYVSDPWEHPKKYSIDRWTNFLVCGWDPALYGYRTLQQNVDSRNTCAILEFARLRLLCALSYMHMIYFWGATVTDDPNGKLIQTVDMVAQLPALNFGDWTNASSLRLPVNPRYSYAPDGSVVMPQLNQLVQTVKNREVQFKAAQAKAAADAGADLLQQVVIRAMANTPEMQYAIRAAEVGRALEAGGGMITLSPEMILALPRDQQSSSGGAGLAVMGGLAALAYMLMKGS